MISFENIKKMDETPSLTDEQLDHFKNVLVAKFANINKNPLLTLETISSQLVLVEDLTVVKKDLSRQEISIELHYLFNNVPLLFDVYVSFDKDGEYTSYVAMDGELTGLNVNEILHLFPIERGEFGIKLSITTDSNFSRDDLDNHYVAQFSKIFNFEKKLKLYNLAIQYEVRKNNVVKKYFKYDKGLSWQNSNSFKFNMNYEPYFVDFMNLLFSNESELINAYINKEFFRYYDNNDCFLFSDLTTVLHGRNDHNSNPYIIAGALKASGDLFIAIMDSPLKNQLLDELKVCEMATY
jgi:hypothetical protein